MAAPFCKQREGDVAVRKLMWFVIGFAAIIAAGVYLNLASWLLIIAMAVGVLAIALCFIPKKIAAVIAAILFGVSAGSMYLFAFDTFYLQSFGICWSVEINIVIIWINT